MQIYLISGESIRLIDEEVNKLISKEKNVEYFDLNTLELEDILTEAQYVSMFSDKRVIVVKNSFIFGSSKVSDKKMEILLKYLENPNEDTVIIFTYNDKCDTRKKITKIIKEKYKYIEIPKMSYNDLVIKIRELLKKDGYTIDNDSINYIINNCLNNYDLIYNELLKLETYYNNPCKINFLDVKNIISNNIDDNNFKFVEAVINKDLKKAFKLLDELVLLKVEPISLISLLSREYRLMHCIKTLSDDKRDIVSISKELKLQTWQTDKLLKNSFRYTYDELENNIICLNECDLQMKKVYFDKATIFKTYLLKMY